MTQTLPANAILLDSFGTGLNAAIVGARDGIGGALADALESSPAVQQVFRLSRSRPTPDRQDGSWLHLDLEDEATIADAAASVKARAGSIHLLIVATGLLHDDQGLRPEKTWRAITGPAMEAAFRINATGPALVAKHFLPLLAKERKAVFAALSARVGSLEDNQLGGWYAYRASKAALNMLIKSLSIELARVNPTALCVGLHPGTVDTALSKPFQSGVPQAKLFSPEQSARYLLAVLDGLTSEGTGRQYAWDGQVIPF